MHPLFQTGRAKVRVLPYGTDLTLPKYSFKWPNGSRRSELLLLQPFSSVCTADAAMKTEVMVICGYEHLGHSWTKVKADNWVYKHDSQTPQHQSNEINSSKVNWGWYDDPSHFFPCKKMYIPSHVLLLILVLSWGVQTWMAQVAPFSSIRWAKQWSLESTGKQWGSSDSFDLICEKLQ